MRRRGEGGARDKSKDDFERKKERKKRTDFVPTPTEISKWLN